MPTQEAEQKIRDSVAYYFREKQYNCTKTMLCTLSDQLGVTLGQQVQNAALGMHGAGGFRAQCGLVEGALMFIGLYFTHIGKSEVQVIELCYRFAEAFTGYFGSLLCYDLRPQGFHPGDEPYQCQDLAGRAIIFAYDFMLKAKKE